MAFASFEFSLQKTSYVTGFFVTDVNIKKVLLTLSENLMSPVGLAPDEETSACLCIEIRKASTPDTSTLFPKKYQTQFPCYFQLHFCLTLRRKANYKNKNGIIREIKSDVTSNGKHQIQVENFLK